MKKKNGYTLVEIMIAMVVLVLGLIPLVKLIGDSLVATSDLGSRSVANELAQDLMEEIKQRKWDEGAVADGSTPAGSRSPFPFTQDATENWTNKTSFDDIDDYNLGSTGNDWGWTETPPRDASNAPLPQYSKFTRSVRVRYMAYTTLTPTTGRFDEVAGPTDHKQITVTVSWSSGGGKGRSVVHSTIMSNIARR
ncbi:MAG: prepilin-type N-terminal cleavage/methylation domain-containing protein [Elusimicrobiota bacterium]